MGSDGYNLALLKTLLTKAPFGFAFFDRELRFQRVNDALAEINGVPAAAHIGRTIAEVLPDIPASETDRLREVIRTGKPFVNVEVTGATRKIPHHSQHWLISYYPVNDGDEILGVGAIVTEITGQKEFQHELREKDRQIQQSFDRMTDAVFALDRDWRFTYLNYSAQRLLRRDDLVGKMFWDEFPEAIGGPFDQKYRAALEHQSTVTFREFFRPQSAWYEVRVYPSPTGLSVYFRDITREREREDERIRLLEQVAASAARQRIFLRDMLSSLTEGRLRLCEDPADLPPVAPLYGKAISLTTRSLRDLRHCVEQAALDGHLPFDRVSDLITGVGEASMNAVVHAGGGEAKVCLDEEGGCVQVWLRDNGKGIAVDTLHRATLERGYTTAGTFGHGFWMMLKTCDRIYLLTGSNGTTVVLEQNQVPPDPAWLRDREALH